MGNLLLTTQPPSWQGMGKGCRSARPRNQSQRVFGGQSLGKFVFLIQRDGAGLPMSLRAPTFIPPERGSRGYDGHAARQGDSRSTAGAGTDVLEPLKRVHNHSPRVPWAHRERSTLYFLPLRTGGRMGRLSLAASAIPSRQTNPRETGHAAGPKLSPRRCAVTACAHLGPEPGPRPDPTAGRASSTGTPARFLARSEALTEGSSLFRHRHRIGLLSVLNSLKPNVCCFSLKRHALYT